MKRTYGEYFIICTVFCTAVFVFSVFSTSLKNIASDQVALVSQFGASITETPTNKLAAELRDMSNNLDIREKALSVREAALLEEQVRVTHQTRNILAGTILLTLITLLFVNAYVYRRGRKLHSDTDSQFTHSPSHIPKNDLRIDLHNLQHHSN